jgi:hypothetical protein
LSSMAHNDPDRKIVKQPRRLRPRVALTGWERLQVMRLALFSTVLRSARSAASRRIAVLNEIKAFRIEPSRADRG